MLQYPLSLPLPLLNSFEVNIAQSFIKDSLYGVSRNIPKTNDTIKMKFNFSYNELVTFNTFLNDLNQMDEFLAVFGNYENYVFRFTSAPTIIKLSMDIFEVQINTIVIRKSNEFYKYGTTVNTYNVTVDQDDDVTFDPTSNDESDGETADIASITQPSNGSATVFLNNVTYTPNAEYYGPDSFTYTNTNDDIGNIGVEVLQHTMTSDIETTIIQDGNFEFTSGAIMYQINYEPPVEITDNSDNIKSFPVLSGDIVRMENLDEIGTNFEDNYVIGHMTYFTTLNTLKVNMFRNSSLISVDFNNIAAYTEGKNASGMFYNCTSLEEVKGLDTQYIEDFSSMFYKCESLVSINDFNMSSAIKLGNMFYQCSSLVEIPNLNTVNGDYFSAMFRDCALLESIGEINTLNNYNTGNMFVDCPSLVFPNASDQSLITSEDGYHYIK